jgi:hypothetical protein
MPGLLVRGKAPALCSMRTRSLPLLFLISGLLLLSACTFPPTQGKTRPTTTATPTYEFPAVNANYVYDQLYYMSMTFQQRESGFDNSSEHNGHKAFAQYWVQEMQRNLQGFHPQVSYDTFTTFGRSTGGWIGRAGDSPSYNVEITIPGALHPEQVVIVSTHYDGMHVSQGSAFDDTSGCAILLGEAKALGDYWRTHQLYPARTLRFVLFDAEEQGVLGSYHYANETVNGDIATKSIVAMINEEQSGFSYPVRFLGKASNPLIPLHIRNINGRQIFFGDLIKAALPTVADEMRMMGYTSVTYHGDQGQDVSQPVFTSDQISKMALTPDYLGGSDDQAFDDANVPALQFIAGDEGIYDDKAGVFHTPNIPNNEMYPFDSHLDTIQLMNGYANGETSKSQALVLALAFQTMLQAWMFNQPALVGSVVLDQLPAGPLAAISDLGSLRPGVAIKLAAQGAFDPHDPQAPQNTLRYHWAFGDGAQADGAQAQHTYAAAGSYTLTLTVQDAHGTRQMSRKLSVTNNPPTYDNIYLSLVQRELDEGHELAQGDLHRANFQMPLITQNGDGLTADDHIPGHNG